MQIKISQYLGDVSLKKFSCLVNPEMPINSSATEVQDFFNEDVQYEKIFKLFT
ncbi:MAG: hypothetical protein OXC92_04455 [Flavobacteriaceae bacterium]|nr:hypothetical protein [Flavobacteriaceae bacterium]